MADLTDRTTPKGLPKNFPRPPSRTTNSPGKMMFPGDLVTHDRQFYTHIQMVPYQFTSLGSAAPQRGTGVILPIPSKINETQVVIWEPASILAQAASAAINVFSTRRAAFNASLAAQAAGDAISAGTGHAFNPYLWMIFRNPDFKEFQLTWTLSANNEKESSDLADIIDYFKFHALPGTTLGGGVYSYPHLALVNFQPANDFLHRFKACAILGINVNYSGAGVPSFYRNGAPTIVNLTLMLKEIELWTKDNYYQ